MGVDLRLELLATPRVQLPGTSVYGPDRQRSCPGDGLRANENRSDDPFPYFTGGQHDALKAKAGRISPIARVH